MRRAPRGEQDATKDCVLGSHRSSGDRDAVAAFSYLTTAPQAVENFRHVGYPQQLRVLLGIGKLAGAIVLLLPRLPTLKEWVYAGFTFMWIAAVVAHYLAGDGALTLLPSRVDRVAGGFIRDAPGESPRFAAVNAGIRAAASTRSGAARTVMTPPIPTTAPPKAGPGGHEDGIALEIDLQRELHAVVDDGRRDAAGVRVGESGTANVAALFG